MDKLIAHRGASAYAPENTFAAFEKARQMGARWIECDVMLSADGEPFVIHDDTLARTTNGKGDVGKVDSDYLKNLDAGSWFSSAFKAQPIPHLRDVLAWLHTHDMQANLEVKPYPGQTAETAAAVLSYLNRYWPSQKPLPLVSSFEYDALTLCRSLSPELPLGFLMHDWDEQWADKAADLQCLSIHCYYRLLNKNRVAAMKDKGYLVFSYTVNNTRLAKKLFQWGVDSVFSDYPDLIF